MEFWFLFLIGTQGSVQHFLAGFIFEESMLKKKVSPVTVCDIGLPGIHANKDSFRSAKAKSIYSNLFLLKYS